MADDERVTARVEDLLSRVRVGVLATQGGGGPYASLVGFVPEEGLRGLLFATSRETRKYANLAADPRVSLLVDDRTHHDVDFSRACAATAVGVVGAVSEVEAVTALGRYLGRFPFLEEFARASTTALLRLEVRRWVVVTSFRDVTELHVAP